MNKYFKIFQIFVVLIFVFFVNISYINATCEEDVIVQAIFRNEDGDFIKNVNYAIHKQIEDVDGNPKPGALIMSGKTSSITGSGIALSKKITGGYYVVKVWTSDASVGAFYYYNDLQLQCGDSVTFEKKISGFRFVLRDAEGELIKDQKFKVYTQRYDVDNNPIKEKQDYVGEMNTSAEGEVFLYVANKEYSLDNMGSNYYIFELIRNGGTFISYDNKIRSEQTTEVEYVFSDLKISLRDQSEIPFPASTKIEIFEQDYDIHNQKILGKKIKDIHTDDKGTAIFQYPADVYVARIMGANDQYQEFWDLEIVDQERQNYNLKSSGTWDSGTGACAQETAFTMYISDMEGSYVSGLNYEIYEEVIDVNGVPAPGAKLASGEIDEYGKGFITFNPDPRKNYALKIYHKNSDVGEFWYFDKIKFICGQDKTIHKSVPSLNVILRWGDESLKKNQNFSIYTQRYDVDDHPIREKKDLVGVFTTDDVGKVRVFLASKHPYDSNKKGTYVFVSQGENKKEFIEYGINITSFVNNDFEYIFSDILLEVKNAVGKMLVDENIGFYSQEKNLAGDLILGKLIKNIKTDSSGMVRFEYPAGYYAIVIKDSLSKDTILWDVYLKANQRNNKELITNLTRVRIKDSKNNNLPKDTIYSVYSLIKDENDLFYKDKKIKDFKTLEIGYSDISLANEPYLLIYKDGENTYGKTTYAEMGKKQEITIYITDANKIKEGQKFKIDIPKEDTSFVDKLLGRILLQVEDKGEAWYVNPKDKKKYYMRDGSIAYEMMRKFGLGITNENLSKIPIGTDARFNERDTDQDGLPDKMEEAIGSDVYNKDSDGDGYLDGAEVESGYNPNGEGKIIIDQNLANSLRGKIVLQVESRGEAWYINPDDGKRYYMKDGNSAYEIMRFLSLGITNHNLEKIKTGHLN